MEKIRYSQEVLANIEASPVPFAIYQFIDGKVVTVALSMGFCEVFGLGSLEEAYRRMDADMYQLNHPEDMARLAGEVRRFAVEGGEFNSIYRSRVGEGSDYVVIHAMGRHIYTEAGIRLAHVWYTREGSYSEDLTRGSDQLNRSFSQVLREGSMVYQNRYDPVAGLPNMAYFFELAEAGLRRLREEDKRGAILYFNLCGMKSFNNRWGFAEGDRLIREFGKLLSDSFGNACCARLGQDHFAAFADIEGLDAKLDGLFKADAALNEGKSLPVSVGVYPVESGAIEIGKACDRAKMACDMISATTESKYLYFEERMLEDAERRQYIIDNLDRAMEEGWIKVYYQPIIRAANGKVSDEEALSRWIDPVRGFMSPGEFIPALESAKLIYKLDLYVVDKVLEKMKRQADAGLYVVPESVNLSRTDFDCCDIVEEIRGRVDASGIERSKLTIEITESVVGSDFEFIKAQVERFQRLGFKVWMDDFGSGYSSLDVLQSIHFDVIKIDMRFMQQFDSGEEGRIILTELVKMAISLGEETVCEGVEREDQVEFLREIGCTKIQGFYYCRPVPFEEILERNRKGVQIGFENPAESDYYTSIGRVNLYDMAVIASDDGESFNNYFDTIPMAIVEVNGTSAKYIRCNKSYREFLLRNFGILYLDAKLEYNDMEDSGAAFIGALVRCSNDGNRALIDETVRAGSTVHAFIRRIAVNPVTGTAAIAVAVLAVIDQKDGSGTTYEHIARALSADYMNLYYVDLETEDFIEYSSDAHREDISVERRGSDFFNASRKDALLFLHKDDQAAFVRAFTKENVVRSLDEQGSFILTYRLLINAQPVYVNMKAMRMQADRTHIIIGISNVDTQVRQKEALARLQAEQNTIARITALSGDYIAIYTIDPETDRYYEYSASRDYEGIGLAKGGEDFFTRAKEESVRAVFQEDVERFNVMFTREKVMLGIEQNGMFVLNYRLMLNGEPKYVSLRAVMVKERESRQLIIGVSNINDQVMREQEYERKLTAARSKANLDGLTGVKNRMAYENMSETLTRQIEEGQSVQYAIALCKIRGLGQVNELRGHHEGDQLIRQACAIICNTFKHSPVFRVAGDEFAVIAQGHDYQEREALLRQLEQASGLRDGASIACGMSRYNGEESVASVFARAEALCERSDFAE